MRFKKRTGQFIEYTGAHLGGMQNNTTEILKAISKLP